MILDVIYGRIVGIVLIALGCLFLTMKKIFINQQYDMIFLCTIVFGGIAINPFGGMFIDPYGFGGNNINPIWTKQYPLIIAAFYLFFIIISYITMRGRFIITNIKTETLMPVITKFFDEKEIKYEVIDNAVVLNNYDNKKIKCGEFLNSAEINFRSIRRLPFYGDIKESFISKVKLIKEPVFPSTGVFFILMGIILIVAAQLMVKRGFNY